MKTTVIGSEKQNGAVKTTSTDKSAIRPAVPLKENTSQVDPDKVKDETKKPVPAEVKQEVKKQETEVPKAELTKSEIKEQLKVENPAMNLEATINWRWT